MIDLAGCEWRLIWDEKQQSPVLQWKALKQDDWRDIVWLDYNDHGVAYISGHSVRFSDKSLTALEHGPAQMKRPSHT